MTDFDMTRRAAKLAKTRRRYQARSAFGYWLGRAISALFTVAVVLALAVAVVASLRYLL